MAKSSITTIKNGVSYNFKWSQEHMDFVLAKTVWVSKAEMNRGKANGD